MARIRTIKPEFWRSPSTAKASPRARLLYIAMWNWADDYGVAEWTPRELLGFAFPNDEEVTVAELQSLCTEVATCFGTQFYTIKGRRFYCIPTWDDHQKNERRAQGKYPRPDVEDACIDGDIHSVAEMRGSSVRESGNTVSGTGEQGNRGTGEQLTSSALLLAFDNAYSYWPKKVERKQALERFKLAAKKKPVEELTDAIITFGTAYAETTDRQFVPGLATWLHGERWTDDLPQKKQERLSPAERAQQTMRLADGLDMKEISA